MACGGLTRLPLCLRSLQGAPSGAVVKHLKVVAGCLSELLMRGQNARPAARAFQATVLQELLLLMATPLNSVRREVAKCMSYLCASRSGHTGHDPGAPPSCLWGPGGALCSIMRVAA